MSHLKKVAVIIPFYRNTISAYESIALQQCEKVLSAYPRIAIKPHSLNLPEQARQVNFSSEVSFDDSFFEGIQGYNRLMLSAKFYEAFSAYEYILIYQMDAFVFSDQLTEWCNQGFDYIGAPWLRNTNDGDFIKTLKLRAQYYIHTRFDIQKNGIPSLMQFENRVGNGGFSLRKVKKFIEVILSRQQDIQRYLHEAGKGKPEFNEDAFWSIEVNRKKKVLKIPAYQTGVKFAFESDLHRAIKLTNGQMPFGCHAWDKRLEFWRPVFEGLGYSV